ncbi:MAG: hypothetical protein ACRDLP_01965, partial [Solirubrobacteraceae bacterium]
MLARVATFDHLDPADLDSAAVALLRQTVRNTAGYVAGFHLHDPKSGKGLSVIVLEGPDAAKAVGEALARRAEGER